MEGVVGCVRVWCGQVLCGLCGGEGWWCIVYSVLWWCILRPWPCVVL